jgi:hypothetical protein
MRAGYYLRKAVALPPRAVVRRAAEIASREVGAVADRWRDVLLSSFPAPPVPEGASIATHVRPVPLDLLRPHGERIARLCEQYLEHRFDILGSGWTRVAHGVACGGVEGHRYEMGGPVTPDPEGRWLARRINRPNLPACRAAWRLVDPGYDPVDWHLDFKSGYRWDETTWHRDVPLGHLPGVDIKVPRELARMHHLAQLAWAYALSQEDAAGFRPPETYVREFRNQVLDFTSTNPPRFGVNWACTMDVAIRAANWLVARDLFVAHGARFDLEFDAEFARSVRAHGLHIVRNLEWFVDLRSNHYLADVAGLLFVAAYLPRSEDTDAWLAFAVQELLAEVAGQFLDDGGNFEGSTSYHRLSSEMAAYATALVLGLSEERREAFRMYDHRRINVPPGLRPAPLRMFPAPGDGRPIPHSPLFLERLERAGEFTMGIATPDLRVPQVGDNDSGRFLKLHPSHGSSLVEDALDHRHLVAALNGLFRRDDFRRFAGEGWIDEEIVRGLSRGAVAGTAVGGEGRVRSSFARVGEGDAWKRMVSRRDAHPKQERCSVRIDIPGGRILDGLSLRAFPAFGLYVYRSRRLYLALRCGPNGQNGNGGHAHNDQLSMILWVDGVEWIADPGTYLYTPLPARRNEYRSVHAHFAPQATDGKEPGCLDLGLFQLGDEAQARCLYFGEEGFAGTHRGFGAPVYRVVEVADSGVTVDDFAEGGVALRTPAYDAGRTPRNADAPPVSPAYGVRRA